jgi:uncharacterized C2H2 Zn-finger protein
MPCPNCDHTMQSISQPSAWTIIYWCPRCGTLRRSNAAYGRDEDEAPLLLARSRELSVAIERHATLLLHYHANEIGFYEACMLPEQRPKLT